MRLFLDPSLRMTGVLLAGRDRMECATIATEHEAAKRGIYEGEDDARRVLEIIRELERLTADRRPIEVVAERPTGAMGAGSHRCSGFVAPGRRCDGVHSPGIYRSAKAEGAVITWVTLFAHSQNATLRWVAPKDVKFALLGKRAGSKDEMVAAAAPIASRYGLNIPRARLKLEAVSDAIGVAVAAGFLRYGKPSSASSPPPSKTSATSPGDGSMAPSRISCSESSRPAESSIS